MPEPGQRLLGDPRVEDRPEAGVRQHLRRDPEAADGLVEQRLHRPDLHQAAHDRGRPEAARQHGHRAAGDVAVDRSREPGRAGRRAERVDHLDRGLRLGVDQVERLAVAVGQVREVVHRLGDVVDRHHVGVAQVDAHQRQPGREVVAEPLEHGEEVVGPVDLVHGPGLRVADHDRGPVDAPRHGGLGAHDLLGLVLRPVVRRGQVLALVEHGLVEVTGVLAGGGHGGGLVEAAHLQLLGQLQGVPGAANVELLVGGVVGGHVVDRREVEEVVDLPGVLRDPLGVDSEGVLREVADDGVHATRAPALGEVLDPGDRAGPHQDEDVALAVVDELLDEMTADEAGGSGHEVRHDSERTCR